MKKRITNETIEYVGVLSKLEITDKECEQASLDMERMLDFFDKMNELNTYGIEPMSHPVDIVNVFREDVVMNGDISSDILKNAPDIKDGMFCVPKTFS